MLPQPLCPTLRQSTHLPNKIIFSALCKTRLPPLPHSPFQTTSSHGRGPLPLRPPGKLSPNRSSRPCRSRPYRSRPIHPVPSPPGLPAAACVSGENQATTATSPTNNGLRPSPRCSRRRAQPACITHGDLRGGRDALRSVPPAPRPPCRVPKAWPAWHRGRSISRSST